MGCDEVSGVPKTPETKPSSPHGVSYLLENGNKTFPGVVFGPVIPQAATVDVRFASNQTIHATTMPAPGALGANVRFYITALPSTLHWNPFVLTPVRSIVGRDRHGHVVARLVLPGRRLDSALFHVSNQGKLVHLSSAQQRVLRSEHRSTLVYLMATRDGESFYRLGGNHVSRGLAHVCYGFGKPQLPYLLPASRRGLAPLVGVIGCTEKTAATFPSPFAPVWDLSIYGATRAHPQVVLQRLAGFASDAVKTVNLLDRKGRVVERVPVIDNVYAVKHVPPGIVAVVPTSFDGQSLARCGPEHGIRGGGTYLRAHCRCASKPEQKAHRVRGSSSSKCCRDAKAPTRSRRSLCPRPRRGRLRCGLGSGGKRHRRPPCQLAKRARGCLRGAVPVRVPRGGDGAVGCGSARRCFVRTNRARGRAALGRPTSSDRLYRSERRDPEHQRCDRRVA